MSKTTHIPRRSNPTVVPILEYLREHGEATVKEMRAAGLDVPNGFMSRLRHAGYVSNRSTSNGSRPIWRLKR